MSLMMKDKFSRHANGVWLKGVITVQKSATILEYLHICEKASAS